MFTGIVEAVGIIAGIESRPGCVRIVVDPGGLAAKSRKGDSICVSGCCLTVAEELRGAGFAFDVVPETLRKTTLGGLRVGSRVNLEASATIGKLLGGHLVQGHVDGIGTVLQVLNSGECRIRIAPPESLMRFVIPKGSIAVDGVSLTVAEVSPAGKWFEVALIPTTLEMTTLGSLREGSLCNVETDIIARTVIHWATYYAGRIGP